MKMKFHKDTFYNGELIFEAGKVYEVSEELGWAQRWIKRGGEVIEECPVVVAVAEAEAPKTEVEVENPTEKSETEPVLTRRGRKSKSKAFADAHEEL